MCVVVAAVARRMLEEIRIGNCSANTVSELVRRSNDAAAASSAVDSEEIPPTILTSKRKECEAENDKHLARLPGVAREFKAIDSGSRLIDMNKCCNLPAQLRLKERSVSFHFSL
jgi:hypothetical protein